MKHMHGTFAGFVLKLYRSWNIKLYEFVNNGIDETCLTEQVKELVVDKPIVCLIVYTSNNHLN